MIFFAWLSYIAHQGQAGMDNDWNQKKFLLVPPLVMYTKGQSDDGAFLPAASSAKVLVGARKSETLQVPASFSLDLLRWCSLGV